MIRNLLVSMMSLVLVGMLIPLTSFLLVGCNEDEPVEGDEAGECSDGADNDQNGLFDCDDPGCYGSPDCAGDDDDDVGDDDTKPDDDDTKPDDDDDVTGDDDDFVSDDDDFVGDDDDFVGDDDDSQQYDGTVEGSIDFGAVTATGEGPYTLTIGVYLPQNFDPGTLTVGPAETSLDIELPSLPDIFMFGFTEGAEVYVVSFLDDNGNGLGSGPDSGDLVAYTANPITVSASNVALTYDHLFP